MAIQRELQSRWSGREGESRTAQVVEALRHGGRLDRLPFLQRYDERYDLRGIPLPVPYESSRQDVALSSGSVRVHWLRGELRLDRLQLTDADLSYADARGLALDRAALRNVRLHGADCRGWRTRGCVFEDVEFDSADLWEAALGGGLRRLLGSFPYNEFRHVSFRAADLRGTVWSAPSLSTATSAMRNWTRSISMGAGSSAGDLQDDSSMSSFIASSQKPTSGLTASRLETPCIRWIFRMPALKSARLWALT